MKILNMLVVFPLAVMGMSDSNKIVVAERRPAPEDLRIRRISLQVPAIKYESQYPLDRTQEIILKDGSVIAQGLYADIMLAIFRTRYQNEEFRAYQPFHKGNTLYGKHRQASKVLGQLYNGERLAKFPKNPLLVGMWQLYSQSENNKRAIKAVLHDCGSVKDNEFTAGPLALFHRRESVRYPLVGPVCLTNPDVCMDISEDMVWLDPEMNGK